MLRGAALVGSQFTCQSAVGYPAMSVQAVGASRRADSARAAQRNASVSVRSLVLVLGRDWRSVFAFCLLRLFFWELSARCKSL